MPRSENPPHPDVQYVGKRAFPTCSHPAWRVCRRGCCCTYRYDGIYHSSMPALSSRTLVVLYINQLCRQRPTSGLQNIPTTWKPPARGKHVSLVSIPNGSLERTTQSLQGPQPGRRQTNSPPCIRPTQTSTPSFCNQSTSQRYQFLSDLLVSGQSRDTATVASTKHKTQADWSRWIKYSTSIGLTDPFLMDFSSDQKHRIIGCFARAVRVGRFSAASRTKPLASGTVRAAMDGVGQTFKAYDLPNPRFDGQNNTSFLLLKQYKGYANLDPEEKQQQAITGSVLRDMPPCDCSPSHRNITPASSSVFLRNEVV
jgi:hypothetical protein